MSYSGLQYLETTGIDPVTGAAVDIPSALDRTIKREVIAGGVIAQGDVVAFDTSASDSARVLTVTQAANVGTGNALACGVALEAAAAAGDQLTIAVKGYVEDVHCTAGVLAGDPLSAASGAAGEVDARVAADTAQSFGVALEAEGGTGTVDVYLYGN